MSCVAKFLPSTAILNLLPDFLKCFLQLNQLLLEPLNLLSNLEFLAEFIELLGQLGDDRLGRGEIAELESLEVLGDGRTTRLELGLELVPNALSEIMELGLYLVDAVVKRSHRSGELLPNNGVLQCFLYKTELRGQVLE